MRILCYAYDNNIFECCKIKRLDPFPMLLTFGTRVKLKDIKECCVIIKSWTWK